MMEPALPTILPRYCGSCRRVVVPDIERAGDRLTCAICREAIDPMSFPSPKSPPTLPPPPLDTVLGSEDTPLPQSRSRPDVRESNPPEDS